VAYNWRVEEWPEAELIARCRKGEAAAWDRLFERYWPAVCRYVWQLSGRLTAEDVEEIGQETFLAVVRGLESFGGQSQLQTWIFRIAGNKARDFLAKTAAAKRGGGETALSLDAEIEPGLRLDPPSDAPTPESALLRAERNALVVEALAQLGDPCREIIELKYFGDLSYDEIAAELRLNAKTVSSRLSKCLDKLEALARPLFEREKVRPIPV